MNNYCKNCGQQINEKHKYCPNCGYIINKRKSENINNLDNENSKANSLCILSILIIFIAVILSSFFNSEFFYLIMINSLILSLIPVSTARVKYPNSLFAKILLFIIILIIILLFIWSAVMIGSSIFSCIYDCSQL